MTERLRIGDEGLDAALANNRQKGLPAIDVSPTQGKLLTLLARMKGAKRVLEIGTLGGYSTICLAQGLSDTGKIVTLEYEPKHATCAKENIAFAGYADQVDIIVGPALESLPILHQQQQTFDFIFIDADKPNNPHYVKWALQLASPGAVLVADNVIRDGEVLNAHSTDPRVQGIRTFVELLEQEERIEATAIQTVGEKGYDGFILGIVR
ncbi:methyltransferase [Shouchella clausii]|nr:methyltransferase [Shouchella clausii]